jgi:hypothetical protein
MLMVSLPAHFRFARRVFQHRHAVRQRCRHHQVLRAGDADQVEEYPRAFEPTAPITTRNLGMDVAMFDMDLRAHRLQALDVQIHRARTDGTTARKGNARLAETRHQRPQHQDRGTHGLYHFIGGFELVYLGTAQRHCSGCNIRRHAHLLQQLAHRGDIVQIRHVVQMQFIRCQQPGAHDGQRRVLRTGDAHFAVEAGTALYR